jgi:uncharacterized protein (TIGR00369 family)
VRQLLEAMVRGDAPPPPIGAFLGMRIVAVDDGSATFEVDVDLTKFANPMGTVHGGILGDLADAAMGCAFASTLAEGESFTTLELKLSFLKPVWVGTLTAVGSVVKKGNTVSLTECRVTDEGGSLVAHSTSTVMTLRGELAAGR